MIQRRKFLRGLFGTAVALPFLETFGRGAEGQPTSSPRRFVYFHQANGIDEARFYPHVSRYGALTPDSFDPSQALAPLRAHADRMIIPRGTCTAPNPLWASGHFHGQSKRLTAAPLSRNELGAVENYPDQWATSVSIDQFIAQSLNPGGRGALTLRVGPYRDSAQGAISYTGAEEPVFGQANPATAYEQLIGLSATSEEARDRIVSRRQSVLDLVRGEATELQRMSLSRADRDKLDMHFTTIRELEVELVDRGLMLRLTADEEARLEDVDPSALRYSASVPELLDLQTRVLALAIATDYTRAATLEVSTSANNILYDFDGLNMEYGHHKISHGSTSDGSGGEDLPDAIDMMHAIDTWHATRFNALVEMLDAYEEEDGTVLDNSVAVWSNELSGGHSTFDVPFIMVGSCGGYFRTGQYTKLTDMSDEDLVKVTLANRPVYDSPDAFQAGERHYHRGMTTVSVEAPHNKLLTMIANACGVRDEAGNPIEMFGTGSGVLPGEFEVLKA